MPQSPSVTGKTTHHHGGHCCRKGVYGLKSIPQITHREKGSPVVTAEGHLDTLGPLV